MKTFAALVVFIILSKEIEPRTPLGLELPYSSFNATTPYYDTNSSDGFSTKGSSDNNDSYSWNSSNECLTINQITDSSIDFTCENGKLYINGQEIENIKSNDRVDVISNELLINGEFIRRIPPSKDDEVSTIVEGNIHTSEEDCPWVRKINCDNISTECINGQLYTNGEKIDNVKMTDSVEVDSNNLEINGKFIRYIEPFGNSNNIGNDSNVDDEEQSESEGFGNNDGADEEEDEDTNEGEADDDDDKNNTGEVNVEDGNKNNNNKDEVGEG